PDLRTISSAGGDAAPARWNIQVVDNPREPEAKRSVGQAVTESTRASDGWVEMKSRVVFDSGRLLTTLLKGGPRRGGVVDDQSQFGPLDRLPGLAVGQRWDERVASPLTGQVETVRAEVTRKVVIHWDMSPVTTLEVVHRSKAVTARTWVRPDGLVLRQEVVLPMLRLVLERLPDRAPEPGAATATPAGGPAHDRP